MPQSEFIIVPCEHGTGTEPSKCKKCFGLGRRYVPRGMTVEELDKLCELLRMSCCDA